MIPSGFISAGGDLCRFGLLIFPLIEGLKIPATDHGFKDATDDEHILAEWHDRWPNANVAVATGAGSGVCVIDVDVKAGAGGPETMAQLAVTGRTLPDCPTSITPSGGQHYWFTHQPGLKNIAGKTKSGRGIGKGVDFRNDGGYVVAPPSRLIACEDHGAGEYRWMVPLEIGFPPLPDWAACVACNDGVPTANIERELFAAAMTAGLEPDKSAATIRSALNRIRGENQ